ncbi:hypothetical protein HDU76_004756, partial [Blyttiomyces sp. JEL0837]
MMQMQMTTAPTRDMNPGAMQITPIQQDEVESITGEVYTQPDLDQGTYQQQPDSIEEGEGGEGGEDEPTPEPTPTTCMGSVVQSLRIIWRAFLSPLGIAFIHIVVAFLKGSWYGPFGATTFIHDGLLGPPNIESLLTYPFEDSWAPPLSFILIVGIFTGLIFGIRTYVDLILLVLRGMWYGGFPELLNSPDGLFSELPADIPVYRTIWARLVGGVVGFGVGIRFVVNAIVMAIKGICYGPFPQEMHMVDGLLLSPGEIYQSKMGIAFGMIFGLGVGLYPCFNFLSAVLKGVWFGGFPELFLKEQHFISIGSEEAYATVFGRVLGWIFGGGVGVFGIINAVLLVPCAFYYGATSTFYLKGGVLGPPRFPMRTIPGKIMGCIFGLYFGFRNFLDCILFFLTHFWGYCVNIARFIARFLDLIYEYVILNLGRIAKFMLTGLWMGISPIECHLADGALPLPKPIPLEPGHETLCKVSRFVGSLLALGVGYRSMINFATSIPKAMWQGVLPSQAFLEDGFPCYSKPTNYPLKTVTARVLGFFFGVIVGFRTLCNLPGFIFRSMWFGAFPTLFNLQDGMLLAPTEPVYKSWYGHTAGWIFGFVLGLRAMVSGLTVMPKGIWLGVFPEWLDMPDALLSPTEVGTWASPYGRAFGIFGGIIGLQCVVNIFSVILRGAWVGILPKTAYLKDGVLGPPRAVMESPIGKLMGIIVGLCVGWRNLIDCLLLGFISSWYGRWGRLYIDVPKGHKLVRRSNGSLMAVVIHPEKGKGTASVPGSARNSVSHPSGGMPPGPPRQRTASTSSAAGVGAPPRLNPASRRATMATINIPQLPPLHEDDQEAAATRKQESHLKTSATDVSASGSSVGLTVSGAEGTLPPLTKIDSEMSMPRSRRNTVRSLPPLANQPQQPPSAIAALPAAGTQQSSVSLSPNPSGSVTSSPTQYAQPLSPALSPTTTLAERERKNSNTSQISSNPTVKSSANNTVARKPTSGSGFSGLIKTDPTSRRQSVAMVIIPNQWWAQSTLQDPKVMGRRQEDWLKEGASTSIGKW